MRNAPRLMLEGSPVLTTAEVARRLGVTEGRVRQFVMEGSLRPVGHVAGHLFRHEDAEVLARRKEKLRG